MYMYMSRKFKLNCNLHLNTNTSTSTTSTSTDISSASASSASILSFSVSLGHSLGHTLWWSFVVFFAFSLVLVPNSNSNSVFVSAECNAINGVPSGTPSNQALVMWVSSLKYTGALGGRSGADSLCTSIQPASVTAAGLTSQALLSYSKFNAIDILPENIDIKNTKGDCIAANSVDLFTRGLKLSTFLFDQNGQSPGSDINVFTATTVDGYKAGLGFVPEGDPVEYYSAEDVQAKYCNDFSSNDPSLTVSSLGNLQLVNDRRTDWIQLWIDTDAQGQCNIPNHIYCITSAPAPTQSTTTESTVAQDPQFVGLQGQRFQVHGIPEEYFNLVSHPFFQLNSHFTYLATGTCNYNDTACWSHPGTYVDELGLMLPGYEIGIFAGEHQHGLTITVNGQTIIGPTTKHAKLPFNAQFPIRMIDNETINSPHTDWLEPQPQQGSGSGSGSDSDSGSDSGLSTSSSIGIDTCTSCWLLSSSVSVSFLSRVHVVIDTPVATLDIYNADHFFNFALELRAPRLLLAGAPLDRVPSTHSRSRTPAHVAGAGTGTGTGGVASAAISPATSPHPTFPMHGLVGQTWKNVKYPHGRLYAGEVDDYILSDRRLFSTNFVYNEYQY